MSGTIQMPNVFIVGAAKAGTTTIVNHLTAHPQVYISSRKEPGYYGSFFFDLPRKGIGIEKCDRRLVSSFEEYQALFSVDERFKIRIDASTDNLFYPGTADLIKENHRDARIIICLRHPVERAYSAYHYLLLKGREHMSFDEAIQDEANRGDYEYIAQYVRGGFYAEAVRHYRRVFGDERIRIVLFEEFVKDVQKGMDEIFEHVGLTPIPIASHIAYNKSGSIKAPRLYHLFNRLVKGKSLVKRIVKRAMPRHSRRKHLEWVLDKMIGDKVPMSQETRMKLLAIYREDTLALSEELGIDLAHWLK